MYEFNPLVAATRAAATTYPKPFFRSLSKTYERKELPAELSRNMAMLTCKSSADGGVCHVYLVGTYHTSMQSCLQVKAVIEFLKPQAVFLELCNNRRSYSYRPARGIGLLQVPTNVDIVNEWKKNQKNLYELITNWFNNKFISKCDVLIGGEYSVAHEEATKYGATVYLGDRDNVISSHRLWANMPLWYKMKAIVLGMYHGIFNPIDAGKQIVTMYEDEDGSGPVYEEYFYETMVHERDQYMSATLLQVSRQHNSVVAVVGTAHLQGIQKHWEQPVDMRQLLSIPAEKKSELVGERLIYIAATIAGVSLAFLNHNSLIASALHSQRRKEDCC